MTESKQRKIIYWAMATVFFALFLFVFAVIFRWCISSQYWVGLMSDIDHRMKPEKFKDLNSDGIRSPLEASSINENDFNIVFLGDSFVHGFILQYKLAPPKQLQDQLRAHYQREDINVWNFGWTSSSPILQLRLLQDIGKKYQPDLVILSLDMSDYRDDYFYRHTIKGEGIFGKAKKYPLPIYLYKQLLTAFDGVTGWHKKVWGYSASPDYFVATQPLKENRHLFDEVYDSLNQINAYTTETLGVPFVVFIPPRHWQYTDRESPDTWEKGAFETLGPYALENYKYFDEKRERATYPLISLLDEFKQSKVYPTTFKADSHWNKHGAKLMAELVVSHLQQQGYLAALATKVSDSPPQ